MKNLIIDILLIAIVYTAFTVDGIYEEKLYKTTYIDKASGNNFEFQDNFLRTFLISLFSSIVSGIMKYFYKVTTKQVLMKKKDKLILGSMYFFSRSANGLSISYLDYISKTIGKSCKSFASKDI